VHIFESTGLRYDGNHLLVLDQTLLPQKEVWVTCDSADTLINLIQRLAIRGAPLIGVSASVFLGIQASTNISFEDFTQMAMRIKAARPTAVNLMNNIEQILAIAKGSSWQQKVKQEAIAILNEDKELCEKMAIKGADLIHSGNRILTHCNTGGLATSGVGTALGVIIKAHQQDKSIHVWVDETRPLLQGGRLTAWELQKEGVNHQLICDSMAAMLMQHGRVDKIFVGSDRIARNGDFANKIGTYSLAVLANYHKVPFYVVAPQTTVDAACEQGADIPIEMRDEKEVKGAIGGFGSVQWAPETSSAFNPAFDVTPAELVTGWVLDTGVFQQQDLAKPLWWLG
jgi:methylthioribose-1-phosphate isomerase